MKRKAPLYIKYPAFRGLPCRLDLEKDWKREAGKQLLLKWLKMMGIDKGLLFIE